MNTAPVTAFEDLDLPEYLMKTLNSLGYETPTPIQGQTVPPLLAGKDVVGQAQTGTGKTAAFALPIIANLDINKTDPQVLVLTPTRELAIQVAEAFQRYASQLPKFRVLPVYGGQDYQTQTRALARGVHVVVGTPGRVMDQIRRRKLSLKSLDMLVLDEADEMLKMGFIDDVEWILEQTPDKRQIALFSATMPQPIRKIASKYLNAPVEITIQVKTKTAETIRQHYWPVRGPQKIDALTRILEAETFDAMLVFVRTKNATVEIAEKLAARGYLATALNGDIPQPQREKTIKQLKARKLDIVVATDVAARGLDVERISHVINYDIPHDAESYVHRIGRTGRAGRTGDAILFITPREKYLLAAIERSTRQPIKLMTLPSNDQINARRIERFKQRISDNLNVENPETFTQLINDYQKETEVPILDIAAALARMAQGNTPLLLDAKSAIRERKPEARRQDNKNEFEKRRTSPPQKADRTNSRTSIPGTSKTAADGMVGYSLSIGSKHEVTADTIADTISEEAGLERQHIGRIKVHDEYSEIELPEGMPKAVFKTLSKTWIAGQKLKITRTTKDYSVEDKKPRKTTRNKPKVRIRAKSASKPRAGSKKKPSTSKRKQLSIAS